MPLKKEERISDPVVLTGPCQSDGCIAHQSPARWASFPLLRIFGLFVAGIRMACPFKAAVTNSEACWYAKGAIGAYILSVFATVGCVSRLEREEVRPHDECVKWIQKAVVDRTKLDGVHYCDWRNKIWIERGRPTEMGVHRQIVKEIMAERFVDESVAEHFVTSVSNVYQLICDACGRQALDDRWTDDFASGLAELLRAHSAIDGKNINQLYLYNEYSIWVAAVENRFHVLVPRWRSLRPQGFPYPTHLSAR
jgi:hypothetical protein